MLHRYHIPVIKDDIAALEKLFSSSQKVYYLAKEDMFIDAPENLKNMVSVVDKATIERSTVYLLTNKTSSSSSAP